MPLEPYFAAIQEISPEHRVTPAATVPPGITVRELSIPGPHGPIPLRTYRRVGESSGAALWVHGGGFRHGDLDMPEAHTVSAELAARSGALVVSVGYRLAVDGVRYPVPVDDVHAAWTWLCTTSGDATPALGGASAGAALALATAMRARDTAARLPDALLLVYPFAHFPVPAPDPVTAAEMAGPDALGRFGQLDVEDMVRNYVGRISDLPPDALPGAGRLAGLPPVRLVVAEYDDLRPSAELLERQLREVNVPVRSYLARGVPHGHLNHVADLPARTESLDFLAGALVLAHDR
jgi:acetyl esterase/lipase